MSDVILKVTRLIALASSPNENEARNAAHQACKLIREYKLLIVESNGASDERRRRPAAQAPGVRERGFPCVGCGVVVQFTSFVEFGRFFASGALCDGCRRAAERAEARRREEARRQQTRVADAAAAKQKKVHTRVGVWSVDCSACGRSAPTAKSQSQACRYAEDAGFTVAEDGVTLCPECARREAQVGHGG